MEILFSQIKKMDVVSVTDGKNLGKPIDLSFDFPAGKVNGITVTGCKGFKFTKSDLFIPLCDIVRIGEDVILVRTGKEKPDRPPKPCPPPCPPRCPPCPPAGGGGDPRRNYDEYE